MKGSLRLDILYVIWNVISIFKLFHYSKVRNNLRLQNNKLFKYYQNLSLHIILNR